MVMSVNVSLSDEVETLKSEYKNMKHFRVLALALNPTEVVQDGKTHEKFTQLMSADERENGGPGNEKVVWSSGIANTDREGALAESKTAAEELRAKLVTCQIAVIVRYNFEKKTEDGRQVAKHGWFRYLKTNDRTEKFMIPPVCLNTGLYDSLGIHDVAHCNDIDDFDTIIKDCNWDDAE